MKMKWEEYQAAQAFLETKALGLMQLEKKDMAKTGFPYQSYRTHSMDGRMFYTVHSNVFRHIMSKGFLMEAVSKHPEKFGTGDAMDVVEAIRLIEPSFDTTDRHAEFLRNDQFCLIMENKNGVIQDQVLRIDLFRDIKPPLQDPTGKPEFIGGIFHSFKHFSLNGVNLSTGKDINEINDPDNIFDLAIKAFYMPEEAEQTPKGFNSRISLNDNYWLQFSFYLEQVNGVHFINTIMKKEKKKVTAADDAVA